MCFVFRFFFPPSLFSLNRHFLSLSISLNSSNGVFFFFGCSVLSVLDNFFLSLSLSVGSIFILICPATYIVCRILVPLTITNGIMFFGYSPMCERFRPDILQSLFAHT